MQIKTMKHTTYFTFIEIKNIVTVPSSIRIQIIEQSHILEGCRNGVTTLENNVGFVQSYVYMTQQFHFGIKIYLYRNTWSQTL
jgi:hypothetical protein